MNAVATKIYVKREGAGFSSRMVSPSGVLMAQKEYAATILQSVDLVKMTATERGWNLNGGDVAIEVTDGIKAEYIAECQKEQAHKIAGDITECERMLLDLHQNAWQQLPPCPREIIFDACGQMVKFIKELHEELKCLGYTYDEESEEAVKIGTICPTCNQLCATTSVARSGGEFDEEVYGNYSACCGTLVEEE